MKPPPALLRSAIAVDLVVLTISEGALRVLLIRRGIPPFKGRYALPGGFVRDGEDLEDAAHRELQEETGLRPAQVGHLEQLRTFGAPRRDPRERVISVAYLAFIPNLPLPYAGGDAATASLEKADEFLSERSALAFDHHEILECGIERARAKLEYTPLAAAFCPTHFTILELRRVYEAVWGISLDPANFHRKVTKSPGFVTPTDETTTRDGGRPARLFVRGDAETLHPPLLRHGASAD
jgi:8-oxo-dGTP diphosphatase